MRGCGRLTFFAGEAGTPPLRMGWHYRSVEFQQLDLEAGLGFVAVVTEVAGRRLALDVLHQEGAEVMAAVIPVRRCEVDRIVAGRVVLLVLQREEKAVGVRPLLRSRELIDISCDSQTLSRYDQDLIMDLSL